MLAKRKSLIARLAIAAAKRANHKMFRFEQLEIWRLAVDYGKDCYRVAHTFPKYDFSLRDQLQRAGVSSSNNVAEGSVGTAATFGRYVIIAIASTLETLNIINFAFELGYIKSEVKMEMYEKAEKLIRKLRNFLKSLNDKR